MDGAETWRKYYFVDESGDPNFLGKGKKDLLSSGAASAFFMVGYLELGAIGNFDRRFAAIREEIARDDFLNVIPSIQHSLRCFHANKDCREVQERVFKALREVDFKFHATVIHKKIDQFLSKFHGKKSDFYAYMVERLMENRLHLYPSIDIYFSKMDSVINEENMMLALERARDRFVKKWGDRSRGEVRIFLQQPNQLAALQAVDYCLWAIHRVYNHRDFRYYNFLRDKMSLVHDLSHGKEYYGTYYNRENPITKERFGGEE